MKSVNQEIVDALEVWIKSQNLKPPEVVTVMAIVVGSLCGVRARSVIDLLEGLNGVHALVDFAAFDRLHERNKLKFED